MANEEQLAILKQGVKEWNRWREENPGVEIDLIEADLRREMLARANLSYADLNKADLMGVDLSSAYLLKATFMEANLYQANLTKADLRGADLWGAKLGRAIFSETDLGEANLSRAIFAKTILGSIDLTVIKGVDEVFHSSASIIGTETFRLSKGEIPDKFLRGCGLSDWEIEAARLYRPGLSDKQIDDILYRVHDLRATQAIQMKPLFISYSHADKAFVDKLEKGLDSKGIRFWRDIHHSTAGRLEKVVDRAIRQNPIVLLVLSENSVKSDWVEHEARSARALEKELGRDVLCPMALDEAWKTSDWPAVLREQIMDYNILDFSKWEDEEELGRMFRRMVEGLDLFYKEK